MRVRSGTVPPGWCTRSTPSVFVRVCSHVDSATTRAERDRPEIAATSSRCAFASAGCAPQNRRFTNSVSSISRCGISSNPSRSRHTYSSEPPTPPGTSQRRLTPTWRSLIATVPPRAPRTTRAVFSAERVHVSSAARARPADDRRSARLASSSTSRSASAIARGEDGSTSNAAPAATSSVDVPAEVTTGVPWIIASSTGSPNPSFVLG